MSELLLIRHGQSDFNARLSLDLDSDLSETGKMQSMVTGSWLKSHFNFNGFFWLISPYRRTRQTYKILKNQISLDRDGWVTDDLREYHVDKTIPPLPSGGMTLHNMDLSYYPNETLDDFFDRMRKFLSKWQKGKYVIISHGAPIRTIYHLVTDGDLSDCVARYTKPSDTAEAGSNCGLTWIVDGECKWYNKTVYS